MLVDLPAISSSDQSTFTLLLDTPDSLQSLQVVRRVPHRRIVCKGEWRGQAVFAKLFIGHDALRYFDREVRGAQSLIKAGLTTPRILYQGKSQNGQADVVIYEAIVPSHNAEDLLRDLRGDEKLALMQALVSTVGLHHKAGLIQRDMYPKNFLVEHDRIYTIDGDAIRPLGKWFASRQKLNNLALLLSKFDILELNICLPRLLFAYAQSAALKQTPHPEKMIGLINKQRLNVVNGYAAKKVFRQCTDVAVKKNTSAFMAVNRLYDTAKIFQALADPDVLLKQPFRLLKDGNTCTVILSDMAGVRVVIKRYNIKNAMHAISRALRSSRAAGSWSNAYRLLMQGVPTPQPVALLEKRCFGLRRQAYFVAEYLDAPDLMEYLAGDVSLESKQQVMQNVASLFYKLFLLHIAHGDCKATNIKIVDAQPVLIDLDSLKQYRCHFWFVRRHARDLRRLLKNWQGQPTLQALLINALKAVYEDDKPLKLAKVTSL